MKNPFGPVSSIIIFSFSKDYNTIKGYSVHCTVGHWIELRVGCLDVGNESSGLEREQEKGLYPPKGSEEKKR